AASARAPGAGRVAPAPGDAWRVRRQRGPARGRSRRSPRPLVSRPDLASDVDLLGDDCLDGGGTTELYELLDRASRLLDQLWNESRTINAPSLSMRLGEASHSLHRTLITLRSHE